MVLVMKRLRDSILEKLAHKRDVGRAEEAVTPLYGMETAGMQRDWNEELQSCREFPRKTLQDRFVFC